MPFFRAVRRVVLFALLAALAGCLVPERYIARIRIGPDGVYRVHAIGTAVDADSLRTPAAAGRLRAELQRFRRDGRMQISGSGGAKVRFSIDGAWRIDRGALILSDLSQPMSYAIGPDGSIRLYVKAAVPNAEAAALGVRTAGDLAVTLAPGIRVLAHNAKIAPKSPGGAYRWFIDGPKDPVPFLKIRLPGPAPAQQVKVVKKKLVRHVEKR